jgi:hypothetical protein
MATTKFLFDTFRYTVMRRNDGSIEIAPKGRIHQPSIHSFIVTMSGDRFRCCDDYLVTGWATHPNN